MVVYLSDGRKYTAKDRELQFVGSSFVIIDGERIYFDAWVGQAGGR